MARPSPGDGVGPGPPDTLPRLLAEPLRQAAASAPVVIVTGARQTGKSTLVRFPEILADRAYITLDDLAALDQAEQAPDELVRRSRSLVLDEVQRLLLAPRTDGATDHRERLLEVSVGAPADGDLHRGDPIRVRQC